MLRHCQKIGDLASRLEHNAELIRTLSEAFRNRHKEYTNLRILEANVILSPLDFSGNAHVLVPTITNIVNFSLTSDQFATFSKNLSFLYCLKSLS